MATYRRYWVKPRGRSIEVVRTGTVTNSLNSMWRLLLSIFFWGWPAGAVYDNVHGGWGQFLA